MSPLEFVDAVTVSDAGEPYYCTATELRSALGVDSTVLSDTAALDLIETAEDIVDEFLGGWFIDETTGRKIVQDNVEAWQWSKLTRATVLLAAELQQRPDLLQGADYRSVSGPDFSFSDRRSGLIPRPVLVVLNASGLRRIAGRATAGPNTTRPIVQRFFGSNRYEGM